MRNSALLWLVVGLGACAGDDDRVDYTRLAQTLGTSIATPGAGGETGALADTALIARGGVPDGFVNTDGIVTGAHDGVPYTYLVFCQDLAGAQMACSPATGKAFAVTEWASPTQKRTGMWTLLHLQGDVASVTGHSSLTHTSDGFDVTDDRSEAFLLDHDTNQPVRGDIVTDLAITSDGNTQLTGTIRFDATRLAKLSLPNNVFQIDLDTGDVAPIMILR
jgi:hypothetical protein